MCAENVNSHKCQRHFEVPPGSVFSNKVQLLQMDCSLFKMKKENNFFKNRRWRKKQGAAAADVLLNTLTPINHWLVSPAIYQQLLPRLGRRWPIYQASGPIVIYPTPQPSVKSLHTNTPCRKPKTSSSPKNSALVTEQWGQVYLIFMMTLLSLITKITTYLIKNHVLNMASGPTRSRRLFSSYPCEWNLFEYIAPLHGDGPSYQIHPDSMHKRLLHNSEKHHLTNVWQHL